MRTLALFGLILLPAMPMSITPAQAQGDQCGKWTAGDVEDEGGPVMTATACASDGSGAYLTFTCFGNELDLRYDLAMGAKRLPDSDETATLKITIAGTSYAVPAAYEEMDGMFAGTTPTDGALVKALKAGAVAHFEDDAGRYPDRDVSLKGASAALSQIIDSCPS